MSEARDRIDLATQPAFLLGGVRVDPAGLRVTGADGVEHGLQPRTMQVLIALAEGEGGTVSRETLNQRCWDGRIVGEDAIDRVLGQLRKLGESLGGDIRIETIRGVGVRLHAAGPMVIVHPHPPVAALAQAGEDTLVLQRPEVGAEVPPPAQLAAQPYAPQAFMAAAAPAGGAIAAPAAPRRTAMWLGMGALALALAVALFFGWRSVRLGIEGAPPTIAVLPFADLSPGRDHGYFAEGVSEEILTRLAHDDRLRVLGRSSAAAIAKKGEDLASVRSELGVTSLLEGSLRSAGGRVRIDVRLIDTSDGAERWAESYDRAGADIFAVQEEIAQAVTARITGSMLPAASGGGGSATQAGQTQSAAAYDLYLRGRKLVDVSGSEAEWRQALASFDAAIAADPKYAAAYSGRARSLIALANAFLAPADADAARAQAIAAARRAAELAPGSADVQSTLGFVRQNDFDLAGAGEAFNRSLQLGGDSADILVRYGVFAAEWGNADSGVKALRRAVEIDPLNPRAHRSLALGLLAARRYAEARAGFARALALSPGMTQAHYYAGLAAVGEGQNAIAKAEFAAEKVDWARLAGLGILAARSGDQAGARAAIEALKREKGATVYQQAQVLAQLGDKAAALAALEEARRMHDGGLLWLRFDPTLDPLRREPAFLKLQAALQGR